MKMKHYAKNSKIKITYPLMAFLILFVIGNTFLYPRKIGVLNEVLKPYSFKVHENFVYIGEKSQVLIFSLNQLKLVKKFGKRGEGPGEFKSIPKLDVSPDGLIVNNLGKWFLFSQKGELKVEKKPSIFIHKLLPVARNYAGFSIVPSLENPRQLLTSIILFDKDLKQIKTVIKEKEVQNNPFPQKGSIEAIKDLFRHRVYKDKIFVGDTKKGFYIAVFDSNGNKLYEVKRKFQKLNVTDGFKKHFIERKKKSNDFVSKMMSKRKSLNYVFRNYFPAYKNFVIEGDKIYVFTYKMKNKKDEILVLDLKGNLQKHSYLTNPDRNFYYSISNGKYYYLAENEEAETWELFVEAI